MYWHRINGAMKPSAEGMQKWDAVSKIFGCLPVSGKNYIRVRYIYLEVCVEIWRICHADRDDAETGWNPCDIPAREYLSAKTKMPDRFWGCNVGGTFCDQAVLIRWNWLPV